MHPNQTAHSALQVRFFGVRGSVPTPVAHNLGYGGNTPCIEIMGLQDEVLIIDAGSGIRGLGAEILSRPSQPHTIHLLFTHFHWDHIQGLPFFAPLFSKQSRILFHSPHSPQHLHDVLAAQMASPYFPIRFDELASQIEFHQLGKGPEQFGGISVEHFPLHHPQGSFGYRIADVKRSIIYATDHEHGDAATDRRLCEIARDADILVYDAQYTPEEYVTRQGWGHSTWLDATHVAREAGVRQLALFHHDPARHDEAIDAVLLRARQEFPYTIAAREGERL